MSVAVAETTDGVRVQVPACACGCGEPAAPGKKLASGACAPRAKELRNIGRAAEARDFVPELIEVTLPYCECGCGKPVARLGNRVIRGHYKHSVRSLKAPDWMEEKLALPLTSKCARCGWAVTKPTSREGLRAFKAHARACPAAVA